MFSDVNWGGLFREKQPAASGSKIVVSNVGSIGCAVKNRLEYTRESPFYRRAKPNKQNNNCGSHFERSHELHAQVSFGKTVERGSLRHWEFTNDTPSP